MRRGTSRPDTYDRFATVYERHWTETSQSLVPVVASLVVPRLPAGARVLDLCCGTGILTADLAAGGLHVVGVDGSRAMLQGARTRCPGVALIQADARSFGLRPVFDAVTCVFDSLNHMLTAAELRSAFKCANDCLRPGGWFLFDLNTEVAYLRHWNGSHRIPDPAMVVATSSRYDRRTRLGTFAVTIQYAGSGTTTGPDRVTLMQRCHSRSEVAEALACSGFVAAGEYGVERRALSSVPGPDAERVFYLCRKPG